ncbi:MAG: terpene cyclase/mutase family protein [Planctomycetota bacterium]|nr:terpene cyclase/mutase family protein [Planctomycetota bacterium]
MMKSKGYVVILVFTFMLCLYSQAQEKESEYDAAMKGAREAVAQKDWAEAAKCFSKALRIKPNDTAAKEGFLEAIRNVEIYNTRFGDLKSQMLEKYGMKGVDEEMIQPALKYLAKVQREDGSWRCKPTDATDDKATTAFALLAFLADGNSEVVGQYRETVKKAVKYLLSQQKPDGSFGGARLYTEGLVTLAITEAFAMGGTEETYTAAQKGINYIVKCQKPEGGWMYSMNDYGSGDVSVTGMMFQPLMQGQCAYLDFDSRALERGRKFIDRLTFDNGWVRYREHDDRHSPAMVAIGNLVRLYAGVPLEDANIQAGLKLLRENMESAKRNMYFMYYGTMLAFLAGGELWKDWSKMMVTHLRETQVKEGENRGCWEPKGSGLESGFADYITAVENTAMAVLSLQCCYRYVPKKMLTEKK